MPVFPRGAVFLGKAKLGSGNANVGPVVFGPGYGLLYVYHYIAGYSGSGIAIIQMGTGTTVDTGANYSTASNHWTTSTTLPAGTMSASQVGVRVANDATANARRGHHLIHNPEGEIKSIQAETTTWSTTSPTSASVPTSQSLVTGYWWNTTQAQCVAMNASGALTLNTNSFISVYGVPGTG